MFKRILIANRGEIAIRVIRACKELGIEVVSVYSEADKNSLHVKFADEAICIGPPPAVKSYLNIPAIISAAKITNAEAIHPGYGFLAENTSFTDACSSNDIVFIGPSVEVMEKMGNKSLAKKTMTEVEIPVIPGTDGLVKSEKEAIEFVKKASFPVIIKASSGGGGKGMRVVHTEKDLIKSLQLASAEAQSAFGDSSIYLEKYIEEPRHIEVQILGDSHGNVISLGERDCSIQRRHQKLIEESPGPSLKEENRKKICELAIKVAKTVNYQGAGTVEFLIDSSGRSYFMEMNTRLQVEHPVTEEVTGVDIVKEQIRIATGEELTHKQNEISPNGHAIEFRINAENPEENFLPSSGKVNLYVPSGGLGVRVDSHLYTGYQIPPFYDSLLAKLIVWGESREEAISRAKRALDEFIVVGVPTTISFHKKVVNNAFFQRAEFYTNFVQRRILNE